VSEVPIRVDEQDDAGLTAGIERGGGQPVYSQVEAFEEVPPALIDGGRILQPLAIGRLDGIQVPASRRRCANHSSRVFVTDLTIECLFSFKKKRTDGTSEDGRQESRSSD